MTWTTLAAPTAGGFFGSLGAGGLALALTALLILGIRGRGKVRLSRDHAAIVGFLAGTAYGAAGSIWATAPDATRQGLAGLGVGRADGPFGTVGLGAVALLLVLWLWFGSPGIRTAGLVGIVAATVFAAAGGIWAIPANLVATGFVSFGLYA